MRVGIIIGSIRDGSVGPAVAEWVLEQATARGDADYDLISLRAFDVPLLTSATVPGAANKQYDDERVRAWSAAIDACDAFRVKVETIAWCRRRKQPLVVIGSAGGRVDPTLVRVRDLLG